MNTELVSVIIPAYQAEEYIEKALVSALEQKGNFKLELIIVDDASTDNTEEIVKTIIDRYKESNIIYIKNETNIGVVKSRNIAINSSSGQFIAFLDADDWWAENKINRQLDIIKTTDAVLCYTARRLVSNEGIVINNNRFIEAPEQIKYEDLLKTNVIPCSSVLACAEVIKEFKFENEEMHEDYLLWLKILDKYGYAIGVNAPMLMSRMSKGGRSRNKMNSAKMQLKVYRHLDIGFFKTVYYFLNYALAGWKKYH